MKKINFDKHINPENEQEFIEICFKVIEELGLSDNTIEISFNDELKYTTLGREAYDKDEDIFYIEFNPNIFEYTKKCKIDTIYHEILHVYINRYFPEEEYNNINHIGKFLEYGLELNLDLDY